MRWLAAQHPDHARTEPKFDQAGHRHAVAAAAREALERNEVNRLLGSIIEQRKREAKVQYDKPLLEQFGMLGDEAKGT